MSGTQRSKLPIVVGGAAVLAAAGVGAFFYFKHIRGGSLSPLETAKLVPDDALMAAYIATDAKAWEQLQQFGTPEAQALVGKAIQDFQQNVLVPRSLVYDSDIKPWLGDTMIAVLPPRSLQPAQSSADSSASAIPESLMIVGIKDKLSALNFANKLKSDQTAKVEMSDYKGQQIIAATAAEKTKTYTTLFDQYLVVSAQRSAIEQAIDTAQGQPSFASKTQTRQLLAKSAEVQNPLVQFYLPNIAALVQQSLANAPQSQSIPPTVFAQLEQVQAIAGGIGVEPVGVRMRVSTHLAPQANLFQASMAPGQIVSRFPSNTISLITGHNMSRNWAEVVQQAQANPEMKRSLDMAQGGLQMLGFDLNQDIFGWMDGEFGIAAIPVTQGPLAAAGVGGALVMDTSDRKTAEATLVKLDNLAKQGMMRVAQQTVSGKALTTWQTPAGPLLAHGWLDQDTVLVALGEPIAEAITAANPTSLSQSKRFQSLSASLPKPNQGYFYLDMEQVQALMARSLMAQTQPLPPEANAILSSIRGIGATTSYPDPATNRFELLLTLKPKR
jgi:hypothetical protein